MKRIALLTLAVAALAVAGCSTAPQIAVVKSQEALALAVLKLNADAQKDARDRQAELAKARLEKDKAEAVAKQAKYGAIIKLAEKMDAGGRAAVATSLANDDRAAAPAPEPVIAMPQPLPIPKIEMPKSGWDKFIEADGMIGRWFDRGTNIWAIKKGHSTTVRLAEIQADRDKALEETRWGNNAKIVDRLATEGGETAREGLRRETTRIEVIGNNNTTGGRDATTTTTNRNDCPQTADARGGGSGNSGNGAPGGQGGTGGNVATAGTAGQGGAGAPGGASGQTGAGAPATINQTTNCTAGK